MTTTTSIKSEFLTAILNISDKLLSEVGYNEEKETQLRSLGFVNSDFVADAVDYREFHELAVAYEDKYPKYFFLTERMFIVMKKQLEVYHYSIGECKVNIPDQTLDELLNIEIEMGIIDQSTKHHTSDYLDGLYYSMDKMASELYNSIIGSRGSGKDASMRHSTDSLLYGPTYAEVIKPVLKPMPMVKITDSRFFNTAAVAPSVAMLTTGTDTVSEKKKKYLERLPLTLAEIRKDYPSALIYLRDNVADKPNEFTNHLIALKVEGGYLILSHWEE